MIDDAGIIAMKLFPLALILFFIWYLHHVDEYLFHNP